MNAIDVHGLVKRFGDKTVVDHVTMAVAEGEIVGFLGPNGSGKTTTIRMMCGLLTPDEVRNLSRNLELLDIQVPQAEFAKYDPLTVVQQL